MEKQGTQTLLKRLTKLLGVVALIFTANSASANTPAARDALDLRVLAVRDALKALQHRETSAGDPALEEIEKKLAQWGNWYNWNDWPNWPNWFNWNDWNNWGNWWDY